MNKGEEYPLGWPQLAAMQDQFNNMDMVRDYSYVRRRLILYSAGRMAFLCAKLREYEREHKEHSKCLTENQKRAPGNPPVLDSKYDALMAALREEEELYSSLCSRHREMRQLHPTPREQYRDLLQHTISKGMLDEEGYLWMDSPDEFSSISAPPPPWVIRIVYSRFGKWLIVSEHHRPYARPSRHLDTMTRQILTAATATTETSRFEGRRPAIALGPTKRSHHHAQDCPGCRCRSLHPHTREHSLAMPT